MLPPQNSNIIIKFVMFDNTVIYVFCEVRTGRLTVTLQSCWHQLKCCSDPVHLDTTGIALTGRQIALADIQVDCFIRDCSAEGG